MQAGRGHRSFLAIIRPMDETTHTTRRALIPQPLIIGAVVIVLIVIGAIVAIVSIAGAGSPEVPYLLGLPEIVARDSLARQGLEMDVVGTQVSTDVPEGQVVSQEPTAGVRVRKGTTVRVVLSSGADTVVVPDVQGMDLAIARETIENLGLVVEVDEVPSLVTPGVVLTMQPAAGTEVRIGDAVRLAVPAGTLSSGAELPYDLIGIAVLIDPGPPTAGLANDATLEVAFELRDLLAASGALVDLTRGRGEEMPQPEARAREARESSATVFIGLDLATSGASGIQVFTSTEESSAADPETRLLALAMTQTARLPGVTVNSQATTDDAIIAAFDGPGVRVVIGNPSVDSDTLRLADPAWIEQLARALYAGLGSSLGSE